MPERRAAVRAIVAAAVLLVLASPAPRAQAPACPQGFVATIPPDWRMADRLMLLGRDVSLPKNRSVVLEFHATAGDGKDERLGTYGIVAESETATGRQQLGVLRVNATRPLRQWLTAHPDRTTVCIRVTTVDGSNRPIERLDWTARAIELEAVKRP